MASQAEKSIDLSLYNDPSDHVPSDDQVITLLINKEIPNLVYLEELNKHINNESSFLFVSRISRDRLCIVLETAAQATKLVEDVCYINVNNNKIPINYLVAKSVKVYISNAGHNVSNSALKKYLTRDKGIRTASSVTYLKANLDHDGVKFKSSTSFRRVVWIHPDDVGKLPKGPIKFYSATVGWNVFFEVDNPKCFLCGDTTHFKNKCPKIDEFPEVGESQKLKEKVADINMEINSTQQLIGVNKQNSDSNEALSDVTQLTDTVGDIMDTEDIFVKTFENKNKRTLSSTGSEFSLNYSDVVKTTDNFKLPDRSLLPVRKENKISNKSKKQRTQVDHVTPPTEEEFRFSFVSALENARSTIEVSEEKNKLGFDKIVNLLVKSSNTKPKDRRALALTVTHNLSELGKVLVSIKGLVKGKRYKGQITRLLAAIETTVTKEEDSEDPKSSESESPPNTKEK